MNLAVSSEFDGCVHDGSCPLGSFDVSCVDGLEDFPQHATLKGLGGNALKDVPAHGQPPCHISLAGQRASVSAPRDLDGLGEFDAACLRRGMDVV